MSKMYTNKKEIIAWLDKYQIEKYTVNEDLSVDVDGVVLLGAKNIEALPVQFNRVSGDFNICSNHLTSLKGVPRHAGSFFGCYRNPLKSFDFAPQAVKGMFLATIVPVLDLTPLLQCEIGDKLWLNHPDKLMIPGLESLYTKAMVNSTHTSNDLKVLGSDLPMLIENILLNKKFESKTTSDLGTTKKINKI